MSNFLLFLIFSSASSHLPFIHQDNGFGHHKDLVIFPLPISFFLGKVQKVVYIPDPSPSVYVDNSINQLWRHPRQQGCQTLWKCESGTCSVVSDSLRPLVLQPARPLCPQNSPGRNTGVDCHSLLQGIFLTQGLNQNFLYLLHCRQILYYLSHEGSLKYYGGKSEISEIKARASALLIQSLAYWSD